MRYDIILSTINAKWIHPSLALRLLKANLGQFEERCEIIEFTLRQPLEEKVNSIIAARPRILGLSVSIWNHIALMELFKGLEKKWNQARGNVIRPVIVLGGPEVSYLPPDAAIFRYADFIVRGEGEHAFRKICGQVLCGQEPLHDNDSIQQLDINTIKSAYHLYTDEDLRKKLIYVESSRGCPFNCEFCLSSVNTRSYMPENAGGQNMAIQNRVRNFSVEQFLAEMNILIDRGVHTIKFLDRTFNLDIERSGQILEFFLDKIKYPAASSGVFRSPEELVSGLIPHIPQNEQFVSRPKGRGIKPSPRINRRKRVSSIPLVVHFEMVPSRFPPELRKILSRFPPGTLRLEIGIQTLNAEISARIGRPSDPEIELETLRFLRENTNAIIHADLIAGLPGEDIDSFGKGFDSLRAALSSGQHDKHKHFEIQVGILKLLPGAPIERHTGAFGMRYNPSPPYELMETASLPAQDLERIKNFARFWELIVNRGLMDFKAKGASIFAEFMALSDSLFLHFGRNWGIDKNALLVELEKETHL